MGKYLLLVCLMVFAAGAAIWWRSNVESDEVVSLRPLELGAADNHAAPATSGLPSDPPPPPTRESVGSEATATPAELQGRAVDGARLAIAGARIAVTASHDFAATATTDATGHFRVQVPVLAEGWRQVDVVCRHVLFVEQRTAAIVSEANTTDLGDLVLAPAGGVAGMVVEADGTPTAASVLCTTVEPLGWPPESFPPSGKVLQWQAAAADGRFRFGGLPAGRVRLWAQRRGWSNAWTRPIAIELGQEAFDVRLVVRPQVQEHFVRGVVVGPDDEPVAHARIAANLQHADHGDFRTSLTLEADERGEFLIPPTLSVPGFQPDWRRVRATLAITDPAARYRRGHAECFYGEAPLRVRIARQPEVAVRVGGADGKALARPTIEVLAQLAANDDATLADGMRTPAATGELRIGVPDVPFQLRVAHAGYATVTKGPYTRDVAQPIVIELPRARGIAGTVTANGTPLRGAHVWLQYEYGRNRIVERAGMACLHDAERHRETETDADGHFVLPFADDGEYRVYLYAAHPSHATGQLGPFEPKDVAAASRDFALTAGGVLLGTVHHGGDETARRRTVRVHNGDTQPRYVPVTADGRYRVPRLRPGRYKVDVVDPPAGATAVETRDMPPHGLPFDVEVAEGAETRFDIALQATSFALRLAVPGTTTGVLELANGRSSTAESRDGVLAFAGVSPGRARLRLQSQLADDEVLTLECEVFLRPGATTVEMTLPMATLHGTLAVAPISRLRYRWQVGDAVAPWAAGPVTGSVTAAAGATFRLPVPAGNGTLLLETPGDGGDLRTRELGTFQLPAGSDREVVDAAAPKR